MTLESAAERHLDREIVVVELAREVVGEPQLAAGGAGIAEGDVQLGFERVHFGLERRLLGARQSRRGIAANATDHRSSGLFFGPSASGTDFIRTPPAQN